VGRLVDEIVTGCMGDEYDALKQYFLVNPKSRDEELISKDEEQLHHHQQNASQRKDDCPQNTQQLSIRQKIPFVDTGVYTRNRLFRLLGSSKYGKSVSATLRIAESNKFPFPPNFGNHRFYVQDKKESQHDCSEIGTVCESHLEESMENGRLNEMDEVRAKFVFVLCFPFLVFHCNTHNTHIQ
jgi:hypothetical protein